MNSQRLLKRIHVCGTLWFLLCAATLLVLSLHQAGVRWWVIFSISGYSTVLLLFIFTVYLFAIYQGVVRNQTAAEHPLSTSIYYIALYDLAPFLGSLAGLLGISMYTSLPSVLNNMTQGTLATTFLMWTVLDPAIGMIETALPDSKAHRKQRLEEARRERERQKLENEQLLDSLEEQERQLKEQWKISLEPYAREVASLLTVGEINNNIQPRIIELGALAWKTGGITCMRFFHQLILQQISLPPQEPVIDYTAIWWDGIGTWRKPQATESLYLQPVA